MRLRSRLWACAALWLCGLSLAQAMSVLFINPGRTDEVYWRDVAQTLQMAADSLGITLEIVWAERDHTRPPALLADVLARPDATRPDYLLLTNDYGGAPALFEQIAAAERPIPTFLTLSALHGAARDQVGAPRSRYPFWLGSLEPRAYDAGYLTAQALIAQARQRDLPRGPDGRWHLLAIAGDRSTPTSMARTAGMQKAVAEATDVVLDQIVHADWQRDKATQQATWLFARHPHARLVWAGSDPMAFGAMQAWRQRGGTPGHDAVFSAINTSPEATTALHQGELAALAGGHFLGGAWALVMLYDYHHGKDFSNEGLELEKPMFTLLSAADTLQFDQRFRQSPAALDFRPFSKVFNPGVTRYDFGFASLLYP